MIRLNFCSTICCLNSSAYAIMSFHASVSSSLNDDNNCTVVDNQHWVRKCMQSTQHTTLAYTKCSVHGSYDQGNSSLRDLEPSTLIDVLPTSGFQSKNPLHEWRGENKFFQICKNSNLCFCFWEKQWWIAMNWNLREEKYNI